MRRQAALDPMASQLHSRPRLQAQLGGALPRQPQLVLVSDLDGTLLDGPPRWRRLLYDWLEAERERVLLVYSTGRDLRSVARLLEVEREMGLRPPHLVIGDVGCTVACGTSLQPLPLAVDPIEALWRGRAERVLPLLEGMPGLSPQPISADRRLAYDILDRNALDPARLAALEGHGVDWLISGDRYLDVLPAGVNKGSTLMRLLEWLEIGAERVVTAGDSLNDLAMFETGLNGVMVANAEPGLLAALPRLSGIYRALGEGCEGILEGLLHFGFGPLLGELAAEIGSLRVAPGS